MMSNHIQAGTDFFIVSQLPKTVNPFLRFILNLVNEKVGSGTMFPLYAASNSSSTYRIEQIPKFCRSTDTIVL